MEPGDAYTGRYVIKQARKLIVINFEQYSYAQAVKYKDELNILTNS